MKHQKQLLVLLVEHDSEGYHSEPADWDWSCLAQADCKVIAKGECETTWLEENTLETFIGIHNTYGGNTYGGPNE